MFVIHLHLVAHLIVNTLWKTKNKFSHVFTEILLNKVNTSTIIEVTINYHYEETGDGYDFYCSDRMFCVWTQIVACICHKRIISDHIRKYEKSNASLLWFLSSICHITPHRSSSLEGLMNELKPESKESHKIVYKIVYMYDCMYIFDKRYRYTHIYF